MIIKEHARLITLDCDRPIDPSHDQSLDGRSYRDVNVLDAIIRVNAWHVFAKTKVDSIDAGMTDNKITSLWFNSQLLSRQYEL